MPGARGFGAPVAISSVMLVASDFPPVRAAVGALVANTAPVAFGAMGVPVINAGKVTGLPLGPNLGHRGADRRRCLPCSCRGPVVLIDGRRGLRQHVVSAPCCRRGLRTRQFLTSNYFSTELTDIRASRRVPLVLIALRANRSTAGGAATCSATQPRARRPARAWPKNRSPTSRTMPPRGDARLRAVRGYHRHLRGGANPGREKSCSRGPT